MEKMTTEEAAEYLGVAPKTLIAWRYKGLFGLRYMKVGRRVYYKKADLDAWLESRAVVPGEEEA